jgi:hypothetical protein
VSNYSLRPRKLHRDDWQKKEKSTKILYFARIVIVGRRVNPETCPNRIMCGFYFGNRGCGLQLRLSRG